MLKQGVYPKTVQERPGHDSTTVTTDTYSHVVNGLQEAVAEKFEVAFDNKAGLLVGNKETGHNVGKGWE